MAEKTQGTASELLVLFFLIESERERWKEVDFGRVARGGEPKLSLPSQNPDSCTSVL